ncbi:hypothetical protein C8N46_11255 [Kordia periserrulae]|uniref:Uncharacterized protein n=1 Tax=Kordia periserrulae TaxID=701523 RepID=A0A2T6BS01_9FLAO|nr:hypothetical protein C8N46_11255 [Kordia periserrulae]
MKREPMNVLRLKKCSISKLNAIVAGGPPPPPGSNSCVEEQTCLTCEGNTCEHTCDRTCV